MGRAFNTLSRIMVIAIVLSASSGSLYPLALAEPPRTLIRNAALILTMDPMLEGTTGALGVIENADILLDGDTIAEVGHNVQGHGAHVVDATGKIVLPGFVDVHNHLWQSLIRGLWH